MYSSYPGLVLGYHGCDETLGRAVLSGNKTLKKSNNSYDWLGHGTYFWEFNQERALSFAKERSKDTRGTSKIKKPFVIGAVIDLGNCLNLLDQTGITTLQEGYLLYKELMKVAGIEHQKNTPENEEHPLRRDLDCAVIQTLHQFNELDDSVPEFDSVRGVFIEGDKIYPGAGVNEQNHIQICIRNPNCIKGYFLPRSVNSSYALV